MMAAPSWAVGSDDSLWDLMRYPDPTRRPAAPPKPQAGLAGIAGANQISSVAGARKAHKKMTGMLGWFEQMGSEMRTFSKRLNSDVKVRGFKSFGLHMESIGGNRDSYQNAQYYGQRSAFGAFDNTDMTISGKLGGIFNFETRVNNNLYRNPNDNRMSLNYATKGWKFDAGDIQAGITGNSLMDFSRSLRGVQTSFDIGRVLKLTTLYSHTRAQTRTITIQGANRSGPYYVYAGQVVDGTAKVRVNNREMKPGEDYTLSPLTGELNFLKGFIVGELDVIAISFESFGFNQAPGLITGWRGDLNILKGAKLGFSYLNQGAPNRNGSNNTFSEQFRGFSNPATPYVLTYPVDMVVVRNAKNEITSATPRYPMTVTVDGFPRFYDKDFVVDPILRNRVFFRAAISGESVITIQYVPERVDEVPADRKVMGFDSSFKLGLLGNVNFETASSAITFSNRTINGTAWQARGDMAFLKDTLRLNWNARDIGSTFTAIESPGFRQNEKAGTLSVDYQALKNLRFNAMYERARRPSYSYSGTSTFGGTTTTPTSYDSFTQMNFGFNWQVGKDGQLNYMKNTSKTLMGAGGRTDYNVENLQMNYTLGRVGLEAGLSKNINRSTGNFTGTSGSALSLLGTNSTIARFGLRWRAGETLNFTSTLSNSAIKNSDGSNNTARDVALGAEYAPLKNLRFNLQYALQDSGTRSLLNNSTTGTGSGTSAQVIASAVQRMTAVSRQIGGGGLGTNLGGGLGGGLGTGSTGGVGGFSTGFNTGYFGGGFNSGLGGFGNYSGGFGSGISPGGIGYGASFGGNSRNLTFLMNYQPSPSLTLDLQLNNASSQGDYLFNSKRNDATVGITYTSGDRWSVTSSISMQKVAYIGSEGGTNSNMFFINLRSKPFGGKFTANLGYQNMLTNTKTPGTGSGTGTGAGSGLGTGTGTGFGAFTGGASNLNAMTMRLEYPLWKSNILYFQFDNALSGGYLASTQRTMLLGVDFDVFQNLRFTLGLRHMSYTSTDSTQSGNYNFRVNSLDADLNFRF
jgi:hypothetical protein